MCDRHERPGRGLSRGYPKTGNGQCDADFAREQGDAEGARSAAARRWRGYRPSPEGMASASALRAAEDTILSEALPRGGNAAPGQKMPRNGRWQFSDGL
jgi:hypothetical protein